MKAQDAFLEETQLSADPGEPARPSIGQVVVRERGRLAVRAHAERQGTAATGTLPFRLPGKGVPSEVREREGQRLGAKPQHEIAAAAATSTWGSKGS